MRTRNLIYIIPLIFLFVSLTITSCKKEDDIVDSELPRLFRPTGINMQVNKNKLQLSWYQVDGATAYVVQISNDSLKFENIIISDTVSTNSYTVELGGDMVFSVRVKAITSGKESEFKVCGIVKTPPENIFIESKSFLFDQGTYLVTWTKNSNVTHLVVKTHDTEVQKVELSEDDVLKAFKIISGLANGFYTVEAYNGIFKRGAINIKVDGDYFVSPGDNLANIISSANNGALIYIKPGNYNVGSSALAINNSITLKGLFADTLPVLYMDDAASATANMLNIATTSKISKIIFENIDFMGYTMNDTVAGHKIGYLFNQDTSCDVDTIIFNNCKIHNLGNTPFRLKESPTKTIGLLSFNNCIIYDIGYSSTYALVNNNVASIINNIEFKNSTVYNFTGSIILHNSNNSKSITIENCTFNEISTSGTGTTIRYIIDYGTNYTVDNGIIIKNCIFGKTPRDYTGGIRTKDELNIVTVNNSYYTADYNDAVNAVTTYSIKGIVTKYSGNSTDLWVNPTKGIFNFKDLSFPGKSSCGDPRWRVN